MNQLYHSVLSDVSKYITFLEETILIYEEKCRDMELEDMIEHNRKYPGKSVHYYNRLIEIKNDAVDDKEDRVKWAYSPTSGTDDAARSEALSKAYTRAEIEKNLDNESKS